jgi:predicted ester cyclase
MPLSSDGSLIFNPKELPTMTTRQAALHTGNEETKAANKAVVVRFNREVIEQGSATALRELVAEDFVNRTAPPGSPAGRDAMLATFNQILRPALPDLAVEIHDQIAEGDRVCTRKTIHGTHLGELFGIAPTQQRVAIEVIDIVRVKDGRYAEHWGINTLAAVVEQLRRGA